MNLLKEKIEKESLSVKDVAEELGVHTSTVYNWMNGDTKPSHGLMSNLAEFLDKPLVQVIKAWKEEQQ